MEKQKPNTHGYVPPKPPKSPQEDRGFVPPPPPKEPNKPQKPTK